MAEAAREKPRIMITIAKGEKTKKLREFQSSLPLYDLTPKIMLDRNELPDGMMHYSSSKKRASLPLAESSMPEEKPEKPKNVHSIRKKHLGENRAPLTMKKKFAFIKDRLAHEPHVLDNLNNTAAGKNLMLDIEALGTHYLGELGKSLLPLNQYAIGESMYRLIRQQGISENSVRSLRKMSKALLLNVRENPKSTVEQMICAGQACTLTSLLCDLQSMHYFLMRESYLKAIKVYRKLVPEKNEEGKTRKNITKASKMVKDDDKFVRLSEEFIDLCLKTASHVAAA